MGSSKTAYWLSWILWFGLEQTIIAIGVAFIGKWTNVWKYSDPWVMFFWWWGFCLSLTGFATLVSTGMLVFGAVCCGLLNECTRERGGKKKLRFLFCMLLI